MISSFIAGPRCASSLALLATIAGFLLPAADAFGDEPNGSAANVSGRIPAAAGPASPAIDAAPGTKRVERLREGTRLLDVQGSFVSLAGESVTFAPAGGKEAYRVLENLALQRISQQLDENRGPRQWIVSGEITEFRGANYLLVKRAVVQLRDGDSAANQ